MAGKDEALRAIEMSAQEIVPMIAPVEALVNVIKQVEILKKKLSLDEEVIYYGENGAVCPKEQAIAMYVPRRPLRTYMMAFKLSDTIIAEDKFFGEDSEGKYYIWRYKVRIEMPNGRTVEQIGACSSRDPFFSKKYGKRVDPDESNIMEKAMTAAVNRGISDILGGTIPTEEDIRYRHAQYLLKRAAGLLPDQKPSKPGGSTKEQPASSESTDKLIELMKNKAFSDGEREKMCKWVDKKQTQVAMNEQTKNIEKEIDDREKVLAAEQTQQ